MIKMEKHKSGGNVWRLGALSNSSFCSVKLQKYLATYQLYLIQKEDTFTYYLHMYFTNNKQVSLNNKKLTQKSTKNILL